MHRLIIAALITLLAIPAFAADEPKTEDQKTLYAVGLAVGRQLATFTLTPEELDFVKQGMTDTVIGKTPLVTFEAYNQKV